MRNTCVQLVVSSFSEAETIVRHLYSPSLHDPHAYLGVHRSATGQKVIRIFRPNAKNLHVEIEGVIIEAHRVHEAGLFEIPVSDSFSSLQYKIYHTCGLLAHDPYVFLPTFGELDQYLFNQGVHYEIYRHMGGRHAVVDGIAGVRFTVWAPSAASVSLLSDINHWEGKSLPMRSLGSCGIWELFVPGYIDGCLYKFEITSHDGASHVKTDPFGLAFELRPKNGAKVVHMDRYQWNDSAYMQKRTELGKNRPIAIYEVHIGSWRKNGYFWKSYKDIADDLSEYCVEMGFTHVELLPICEHPLDESWGYQVMGFFAPTSRFGSFDDFKYFVDKMHQCGIGVIIDWVPGHFPSDSSGLGRFDGTALYEHLDPRQGWHPHWKTFIFNYGRKEVSNFLIASALFWLDCFHIDGLRVDAVASMLYLDYGREDGQYIPNCYGGKENLEAIEFLRHANSIIHDRYPGVLTIAEESTAFFGVSHPLNQGGLGFDFKWNMGWMNDTLRYFQKDPIYRSHHQNELTFNLLYAFTEKFISVLSHDEVVHGKKSLLNKMPGDLWQKFANVRLLLSYMICQPGKKLLFMGNEFGVWDEWCSAWQLQWDLCQYPLHKGLKTCVKDLLQIYRNFDSLYADDASFGGFEWVDFSDHQNSVLSYLRKTPNTPRALFCVHNFTPNYFQRYDIPLKHVRALKELLNTDNCVYGGSGKVGQDIVCHKNQYGEYVSVTISLAPLSTAIFEVTWA